ncbi:MAG: hypothetical protein KA914_01305 [Ottowia sp.]|nr:hypothetical protein [Ottowia sp.]
MKLSFRWLMLPLAALGVAPLASAGDAVSLAERDAITATVAQATAQQLKIDAAKLRLVPDRIQRQGAWAFVTAHLRDAAGQRFDYAGTPLHTAAQSGGVSSLCAALLRRDGDGWQLVDIAVGPTDVAWEPWAATHKAPAGLFQ